MAVTEELIAKILLSLGDGETTDYLNLNNDALGYQVDWIDMGKAVDRGELVTTRTIALGISIIEGGISGIFDALNLEIETKLRQARLAYDDSGGGHTGVTLGIQLGDSSTMTYWDVSGGEVLVSRAAYNSVALEQGLMLWSDRTTGLVLQLDVAPLGRSDQVTLSGSPWTVNKANGFTFYEASIPGTAPALIEYTLTDNTSGDVLNKIYIGHRSQPDLDEDSWDPILDAASSGGGSDGPGSITDAIGDNYALDTVSVLQPFTEIANVTPNTPYGDNTGTYDVWARVQDQLAVYRPARNPEITARGQSGSMSAGHYTVVIVAVYASGNSEPSEPITVRLGGLVDSFTVGWDSPIAGTPSSYRVYYKRDDDAWVYQTSASSPKTISSTASEVTGDPPTEADVLPARWRGVLAFSSGNNPIYGDPVESALSNSEWEMVRLFSAQRIPPQPLEEGGTVEAWRLGVEAIKDDLNVAAQEGWVDAAWLLPTRNVLIAEYLGLDLGTNRKFVISGTRWGDTQGILRSKADDSEQGQLSVLGRAEAGPGDTQFVFMPLVANGVSNVGAMSISAAIKATPRWVNLRGT